MPLWSESLIKGFKTTRWALPLALVPFALDLMMFFFQPGLAVAKESAEFTLPVPLPSLPQVHGQMSGSLPFFPLYTAPEMGQLTAVFLLVFLSLQSYATSAYLALLEGSRRGRGVRRFLRLGSLYFSRIFAFNALVAVILLTLESFFVTPTLILSPFIMAGALAFLYFVFLTPFAVVVDDYALGPAFRRAVELAYREWRELIPYCLAYVTITLLVSAAFVLLLPSTALGTLIGIALYSVLGTALVASTIHLYRGLLPKEELAVPARPSAIEEVVPT